MNTLLTAFISAIDWLVAYSVKMLILSVIFLLDGMSIFSGNLSSEFESKHVPGVSPSQL